MVRAGVFVYVDRGRRSVVFICSKQKSTDDGHVIHTYTTGKRCWKWHDNRRQRQKNRQLRTTNKCLATTPNVWPGHVGMAHSDIVNCIPTLIHRLRVPVSLFLRYASMFDNDPYMSLTSCQRLAICTPLVCCAHVWMPVVQVTTCSSSQHDLWQICQPSYNFCCMHFVWHVDEHKRKTCMLPNRWHMTRVSPFGKILVLRSSLLLSLWVYGDGYVLLYFTYILRIISDCIAPQAIGFWLLYWW